MSSTRSALRLALGCVLVSLGTLLLSACGGGGGGSTAPPASAPTASAAPADTSLSVVWTAVSGATLYHVYFASVPGVTPDNYSTLPDGARYDATASPYTRTGLTNGQTYYFVVTAANGAGEGPESSEVSAAPVAGVRSFTPAADMTEARSGHSATLLGDGTVLVAGGYTSTGFLATAELYDPTAGTFTPTGSMGVARSGHTATLLADGTVLMVGGVGAQSGTAGGALNTVEIYDPTTGTFIATTGNMVTARYGHTATLLPDNRVLIAGGRSLSNLYPLTAEIYDPTTGTFTATTGNMTTARYGHTATLLGDGRVLLAGGFDGTAALDRAETYDSGTFVAITPQMPKATLGHTATLLGDGRVLLAGGFDGSTPVDTAALFDPLANTFTATGAMTTARLKHTATLLSDGTVLIAGGANAVSRFNALASAELYDPPTGLFTATGNMYAARIGATATLLPNDLILLAGGANSADYLLSAELFQ